MLSAGRTLAGLAAAAAVAAALAGCEAPQQASDGLLVIKVANAAGNEPAKAPKAIEGRMEVGQRLEVQLGASAGTGFSWQMAGPAPAVMSMQSTDPAGVVTPVQGEAARPGGGTVTTYAMTAISQGEARLRFVLARPWEKGVEPARIVDLDVQVDPRSADRKPASK